MLCCVVFPAVGEGAQEILLLGSHQLCTSQVLVWFVAKRVPSATGNLGGFWKEVVLSHPLCVFVHLVYCDGYLFLYYMAALILVNLKS